MNIKKIAQIGAVLAVVLIIAVGVATAQGNTPTPASPAPQGADAPVRTISVTGSGKATLSPDIAFIFIGVHTEGEDAAQAVEENNQDTEQVVQALRDFGVAAADIRTNNFSIYPNQRFDPSGQPTGEVTYMVDNNVHVTVRDLDRVGDLLDAVVQSGANSINGIQFDVEDKTAALSEARKAALADAGVIAAELAEAAGAELGQIQAISTLPGGYPMPYFAAKGGGAMDMAQSAVPVTPGQMEITVDVSVVYAIQ